MMPDEDLKEAEKVWEATREKIIQKKWDEFPKSSENRVAHVRPHGRDSNDRYLGSDGKFYQKKSFWLNAGYLKNVISEIRKKQK